MSLKLNFVIGKVVPFEVYETGLDYFRLKFEKKSVFDQFFTWSNFFFFKLFFLVNSILLNLKKKIFFLFGTKFRSEYTGKKSGFLDFLGFFIENLILDSESA